MRLIVRLALGLTLVLAVAACTGGGTDPRTPTPTAPTTGPAVDSLPAFQDFSGLTIPPSAEGVDLRVTAGPTGEPAYRVKFSLPSDQIDQFCRDGQMNRPLRVTTIPASVREAFDYQGDSSTGVAIAEASLPSNVRIQRQVLAVGTKQPVAEVQVYAYAMGS